MIAMIAIQEMMLGRVQLGLRRMVRGRERKIVGMKAMIMGRERGAGVPMHMRSSRRLRGRRGRERVSG